MSCKNCTRRQVGCHATCEEYKKEKKERDAVKEKIRKERSKESLAISREFERIEKAKRRSKK